MQLETTGSGNGQVIGRKKGRRRLSAIERWRIRTDWAFILPQLAIFVFLTIVPLVIAVPMMFTDQSQFNDPQINNVGLRNFLAVFNDPSVQRDYMPALRKTLLFVVLGVSMFPQIAVLSGMFELIRAMGLYNNLLALTLSYMIFTLPFTVWVLTTFMRELPKELEEAAIVDGAGPFTIVTKVFMPLMGPALATTGLLAFIAAWNEFLFALTFTLSSEMRTVPVAIALISGASAYELPWGNIMAASVTVTVPLIVLVLIFQRRIVSGLTAGAVKG